MSTAYPIPDDNSIPVPRIIDEDDLAAYKRRKGIYRELTDEEFVLYLRSYYHRNRHKNKPPIHG